MELLFVVIFMEMHANLSEPFKALLIFMIAWCVVAKLVFVVSCFFFFVLPLRRRYFVTCSCEAKNNQALITDSRAGQLWYFSLFLRH